MMQQAEAAKAKMYQVSGNNVQQGRLNPLLHSVVVDEEYAIIGAHVDESIHRKIKNEEFIDFAKLLPRDKIGIEQDKRLEIVTKNGQTFFQPISEREGISISRVFRWDQAFCIFSAIYTESFPSRANELLQYCHIIHHEMRLFIWENVYASDIDF